MCQPKLAHTSVERNYNISWFRSGESTMKGGKEYGSPTKLIHHRRHHPNYDDKTNHFYSIHLPCGT